MKRSELPKLTSWVHRLSSCLGSTLSFPFYQPLQQEKVYTIDIYTYVYIYIYIYTIDILTKIPCLAGYR